MKIGIDIGGSHKAIGVVDEDGKIVEKIEKKLSIIEKQDIKLSIEQIIIENVNQFMKRYNISEIGMAIPGWAENGIIIESGNVGIKNYPIQEKIQEKIKLPIKIKNDAKCAAIAENTYGCLKNYKTSLFLTLGTGIGGAVFIDNKLLEGSRRPGCEIGHMVIKENGIPCCCGRKGCFEKYASMKAFKTNLRNSLGVDQTTRGEELLDIIRKNKPEDPKYNVIEKIVSEYIENLSIGIENLINIFEPEIIGIGGSFVYFADVFLPKLSKKIKKANENKLGRENMIIETAVLGNDAGIIGATLL